MCCSWEGDPGVVFGVVCDGELENFGVVGKWVAYRSTAVNLLLFCRGVVHVVWELVLIVCSRKEGCVFD